MHSMKHVARWIIMLGLGTSLAVHSQDPVPTSGSGETMAAGPVMSSETRSASRRDVDPGVVAADALVVRPVGLAATAVGAAIFVVALPFAALAGDVNRTGRILVGAPAQFTFQRRLGDFDTY
jgi:hypothetical protein